MSAAEIPSLILTRNLYGIELDERAGALAAFALTMKAAARWKRSYCAACSPTSACWRQSGSGRRAQ